MVISGTRIEGQESPLSPRSLERLVVTGDSGRGVSREGRAHDCNGPTHSTPKSLATVFRATLHLHRLHVAALLKKIHLDRRSCQTTQVQKDGQPGEIAGLAVPPKRLELEVD